MGVFYFKKLNPHFTKFLKDFSILVMLIAILIAVNACRKEPEGIVAQVGTEHLTVDELVANVPEEFRGLVSRNHYLDMVRTWIEHEAMYQAALKEGMEADPEYLRLVEENRKKILVDRWLQSKIAEETEVYESEKKTYFESHREQFLRPETVYSFRILKGRDLQHGWAIRRQITLNGFEHQADYQISKGNHPVVVVRKPLGRVDACLRESIASTKVGTATVPINCEGQIQVVQIDERLYAGASLTYEEVYPQLESIVRREKNRQNVQKLASQAKQERPVLTFFERIPGDTLMSSAF